MRKSTFRNRIPLLSRAVLALIGAVGLAFAGGAQILTWNPAQSATGPSDGNGSWLASGVWWNGTANVNGTWSGNNLNGAAFGAGTPGSYTVNLSSGVAASNVTFNTSGYTLAGGALTLSGGNDLTNAGNINTTIASPINQGGAATWIMNSGSTLTLSGGGFGGGGNFVWTGGGTVSITNGTYTPTILWLQNITNLQTGGTITLSSDGFIGYAGNTTYTINGGSAALTVSGKMVMGRGGNTGVLNLQNGAVAANGANTPGQPTLGIGFDNNSVGILNISGGSFTVNTSKVLYLDYGATSSGGAGTVNLSGGALYAPTIQFGNGTTTYNPNTSAALNISGGTLYLGSGGIAMNSGGFVPGKSTVLLSGGVIVSTAAWTSSLPMTLTNLNGDITFQAANAVNTPFNVSLSGALSGLGGLIKTGGGMLALTGANTYSGDTIINAGTLALTTASTGAGTFSVASNATLSAQVAVAGASLNMSSLTFGGGSILSLDPNTFGNPTAPIINVSGALTPTNTVTINVNGSTLTNGQFTLIKYGSLGGSGFGAFSLGTITLPVGVTGSATLVNNTLNQSIDLNVTIATLQQLVWDGTVNGNWDIGGTANWKTNAYYTQSNGAGPVVVFDDTASGSSTAIMLNTNVTPASVTVSNSTRTYSINGSGGITGAAGLVKAGSGTFTLGGNNTYTGGTAINAGTLAVTTTNNAAMNYFINGGKLATSVAGPGTSLQMSSLTLGAGSPQLTFDFQNLDGTFAPAISDSGNLTLNGNVTVNATNLSLSSSGVAVLLRYGGTRSGTGSFVAGTVPAGVTVTDDTVHQQVIASQSGLRVVIPSLNTNEEVVAAATPQMYGAVGDGVTDDTTAFQNAINAVYNSGGNGGGVVWIPAGNYAFYGNLSIPTGVTLHGNWTDWTKGTNGLVGTTFCIYTGAGQTNGTPFITMSTSAAVRDINFWYPNQNPSSITGYPFTISAGGDTVIQNVVLVNSYQGIQVNGAEFILSTVIGTPLFMGFTTVGTIADISQTEDVRFSPAIWPASLLPNAPAAGGSYATWMRTYGTGMQSFRLDGLINVNTEISGYNIGLDFEVNSAGQTGCAIYNGWVTNCATALLAQEMQTAEGLEISHFTLDGDVAIARTHATNDAAAEFDGCQIIGRSGTAVSCLGANWQSSMSFQNCTISNALNLAGPGVFNLVNCRLLGSTQCVMSATANRVGFTGCTFSPSQKIINNGSANNLLIDPRTAISNAMPVFDWTNVMADFATRRPAKTNLFVATSYGATGNGVTDDTKAIQNALAAAGTNGGGIVYLPGGLYHVTNTLDVPSGVEFRGAYELRHSTWPGGDGKFKGAILQPYGGQGTTNGPPAVALEANSGLVGMTISYESQWTNCFPFPPAIQGRGPNVYMIGVQCPNPYYFVDLDTYTCTNHFIDMLDGWALKTGVAIGNGSSGTIADCHANWTFWIDNFASPHALQGAAQAPVLGFAYSNLQYYVLGNCSELFVKDFSILENVYMHCSSENGVGPTVTGISAMCDATYQCFVFDSAAPCTFNDVNLEWLVSLNGGYPGLTNQAIILTTSNFQGTVRFFNSPIWGSHNSDYIINGGDVGLELVHLWQFAYLGTQVNGGVFHLVNCGAFNGVDGNGTPQYNLTFGPEAGQAGKTNEVIGCFSYSGWNVADDNVANPMDVWMDYAISNNNVLSFGPVIIGDVYPDGLYQFEPSGGLAFMTSSSYGINPSGIRVILNQTNLLGTGQSTTYTTANGLVVSGTNAISVTTPLVTNMLYNAVISVTDTKGNSASNVLSFDTVSPAMTFEAEDFDYNSGNDISNPSPDAYAGLSGAAGIDFSNSIVGQGSASYRPQGLETEAGGDKLRASYGGLTDYDLGFANVGNWGNYTRVFPAGSYNIYARVASPNAAQTQAIRLSQVTGGWGTSTQTTASLGTFSYVNTGGWQSYTWMPLLGSSGQPFVFQGGSSETLRATELKTGYNLNYYMLVATNAALNPPQTPVTLQLATRQAANNPALAIAWPGSVKDTVTNLYWTPVLTPPITWARITNAPIFTNGQWVVMLPVGTNGTGFYRLQQ